MSEPRVDVSVIVPVKDGEATISEQLDALRTQTFAGNWELLVVDNGSTDRTVEIAASYTQDLPLRVVDAADQPGSSHARNVGAREAAAGKLAFCDADDVVESTWLSALVDALEQDALATGEQHTNVINTPEVEHWRSPRQKGRVPSTPGFLSYVPSCNLGVRRDVYQELGGFDPEYVQAHDVDFSYRAQLAGHTIGFAPQAIVHYRYRSELATVARQARNSGKEAAQLYREYRADGLPRTSLTSALRTWLWIPLRIPLLFTPTGKGTWVRRTNEAIGRLVGSLEHRVWYP